MSPIAAWAAGDTNRAPSYFQEHRRHSSLNDWFALRFAEVHGGILLTGDGDPRRIATGNGVEVHGALWAVVLTADHATCLRRQLTGASEIEVREIVPETDPVRHSLPT